MGHIFIGITGGSGAGKTAFTSALREKFSAGEVAFLSQDDYYFPIESQLKDERGIVNFDRAESIDLRALLQDMTTLRHGGKVQKPRYLFNNPLATPSVRTVLPAKIIVLEGMLLPAFPDILDQLDLSVIIHATAVQRLNRRIERDRDIRNYPREDVIYRFEHHVSPAFRRYIQPFYEKADLIVNNTDHFRKGLRVLEYYIRYALQNPEE